MSTTLEFSRPQRWGSVPAEGRRVTLKATETECAALARRFDILSIPAFGAELELRAEPGGTIRVRGRLTARVVQACVVTLEPVEQTVEDGVDLRFLPEGREPEDGPDGPDEIPSEDGMLELGEALAEQLSLALDPYPRAPGAALPETVAPEPEEEAAAAPARPNPFAVLKGGRG